MPGWPDECKLTNLRVSRILFGCIESEQLTVSQLKKVRKTLGYLWELNGTRTKRDTNWPCVGTLMEAIRPGQLLPNQLGTGSKARFIPSPAQLPRVHNMGLSTPYISVNSQHVFLCVYMRLYAFVCAVLVLTLVFSFCLSLSPSLSLPLCLNRAFARCVHHHSL